MNENERSRILIVEDEISTRMALAFQLQQLDYAPIECASGEECLERMDDAVDILLLDIGLPGIDGIETCRQLRERGFARTQIIFISVHDDLETRLTAYDAGGDDFIVKPFEFEEMERKLRVAERSLQTYADMAGQARFAQQAAFSAMSSMGEQGAVMELLRNSFQCDTPDALARSVFSCLEQLGIEGLLSFHLAERKLHFCPQGSCSPLEASILDHTRKLERIFQLSTRLAINYPRATLVISNLPTHDPDRCGRLRDHLAVVVECCDSRMLSLSHQFQLEQTHQTIAGSVHELLDTLADIKRGYEDNARRTRERASEYMEELEDAFVHLGLTERQETELVALAQKTLDDISALTALPPGLEERFRQAVGRLPQRTSG